MPRVHVKKGSLLYRVGAIETLKLLNRQGKMRFTELYDRKIFGTPATLAHRLRELEGLELITKDVKNIKNPVPVKVYYVITERGKEVLDHLKTLEELIGS